MKLTSALSYLDKDGKCFVCGQDNPVGLRMVFRQEGEKSRSEFTPQNVHVSWAGLFHGGLMTAVLDEAIGWVLYYNGVRAMTARMEVRFRQPVLVGQRLDVTGEITRRTRKIVNARAFATLDSGEVAAEIDATMFVVNS